MIEKYIYEKRRNSFDKKSLSKQCGIRIFFFDKKPLSKQGVIQSHMDCNQPGNLYKLLKAKYFKGTLIWKMKEKHTDSWCWKSILSARSLLEERVRKRVGDGKTIDIWKDRWIPGVAGGKVSTQQDSGLGLGRVSELIKNGNWNEEFGKGVC